MPKFNPTNPNEFSKLLPQGDYNFEVRKGEDGIGRDSGQPWIRLTLTLFSGESQIVIQDYLSFGPKSHKKLWGFCQSTATEKAYYSGEITSESVVGLCGSLYLTTQKDEGYEPKNVVAYYKRPVREDKGSLPKMQESKPLSKPTETDEPF